MAPKHLEPAKGALAGGMTLAAPLTSAEPGLCCCLTPMPKLISYAGMKADAERAKAAALLGEEYKPAVPGVGAAWWAMLSPPP